MRTSRPAHITLPQPVPLFPLEGAVLFPGAKLPLRIFEPRYARMVDDALAGERVIAMVQPREDERDGAAPALYDVGCAGRIVEFTETDPGRYLITLGGVQRFRLLQEIVSDAPYRLAEVDWREYAMDLAPDLSGDAVDREAVLALMRRYLEREGLSADWDAARAAPVNSLIISLAMTCPFAANEKQAVLEAKTAADRARCLMALMEMTGGEEASDDQRLQ